MEATKIETWEQARLNAAAHMRALGRSDAQVVPMEVDHGVDIRSRRAIAQVRREKHKTRSRDVRTLNGARTLEAGEAWFFSAAGYSANALEYAERQGVLLFAYSPTGELTPVNKAARVKLRHLAGGR